MLFSEWISWDIWSGAVGWGNLSRVLAPYSIVEFTESRLDDGEPPVEQRHRLIDLSEFRREQLDMPIRIPGVLFEFLNTLL